MPTLASACDRLALSRRPSPWGGVQRGRIGILGGSFNPAHDGHRHISLEALKRLHLDQVWWLVSPQNPLKPRTGMADLPTRLRIAQRVARHPQIRVCALEQAFRSRYTVDTVRTLQQRFPKAAFVWLMGADNMVQMPRWRRWQTLFHSLPIAIFDRDTYAAKAVSGIVARRFARQRATGRQTVGLALKHPPAWSFLSIRRHPASATALRAQGDWPSAE